MKIRWLGHSAFLIASDSGIRIITDPFDPAAYADSLTYPEINEAAGIVTISHAHSDHSWSKGIQGTPAVISTAGEHEARGAKVTGIKSFHDDSKGSQRGHNIMFVIEVDDMRLIHCGDLGHILSDDLIERIGKVNVMLVPVGGSYTIDAAVASDLVEKLKPNIAIPMHYQTQRCQFPIAPVEEFLRHKIQVKKIPEAAVAADSLPQPTEIWVLEHP